MTLCKNYDTDLKSAIYKKKRKLFPQKDFQEKHKQNARVIRQKNNRIIKNLTERQRRGRRNRICSLRAHQARASGTISTKIPNLITPSMFQDDFAKC